MINASKITPKIRKLLDSSNHEDFLIGLAVYAPNNIITRSQFDELRSLEGINKAREWWIYESGVAGDHPTILWCGGDYGVFATHLNWKDN